MDHSTCWTIILALAGAVATVAGAFWTVLKWWRKAERSHIEDLKDLQKIARGEK